MLVKKAKLVKKLPVDRKDINLDNVYSNKPTCEFDWYSKFDLYGFEQVLLTHGASWTRTKDPLINSQMLPPAELKHHIIIIFKKQEFIGFVRALEWLSIKCVNLIGTP